MAHPEITCRVASEDPSIYLAALEPYMDDDRLTFAVEAVAAASITKILEQFSGQRVSFLDTLRAERQKQGWGTQDLDRRDVTESRIMRRTADIKPCSVLVNGSPEDILNFLINGKAELSHRQQPNYLAPIA